MSIINTFLSKVRFLLIRIVAPAVIKSLCFFLPRRKSTVLIIKNDGIGDYILFRNFLYFLKASEKYKAHKIFLLTSPGCKDLALHLDSGVVDGFFYYQDSFFLKWALVNLLIALQRLRLETIIYPNYSRKYPVDWLVSKVVAKNKIAVNGDCINESAGLKRRADLYYSQLLGPGGAPLHEFARNKQLFELITAEKCHLEKPFIAPEMLNIHANDNIVIFVGASNSDKKWSLSNFDQLADRIVQNLNVPVSLTGGKDDFGAKIPPEGNRPGGMRTFYAHLNLVALCELIGGARLLVSGDTIAIHIAAALDIPAVCIYKGDLYGRFVPYPRAIFDKIAYVYPWNFVPGAQKYDQWSPSNINDVQFADVFRAVEKVLNRL